MKKIIINDNLWQTRIAITKDDKLQSLYFASHSQENLERSFFRGIVTKVLPGIQTAFVSIGQNKAGFLHISEIDHELALENISKTVQLDDNDQSEEQPVRKKTIRQRPSISKIVKEGDPILVQVSKEPIYEKGAKLTTCFTLPGRFFVLMPNIPRIGISKKIENREERTRLKDIIRKQLPEGMGGIIRTTSDGRDEQEIMKDVSFLVDTWNTIQKNFASAEPQAKIYEDVPISFQIIRDYLDKDVESVITDNKINQKELYKFVKLIAPDQAMKISLYDQSTPLFQYFDLEKQIIQATEKKVSLKSGGSLIIESTEAMTVVDVNTGRFIGKNNLEDTILKTNLEAAQETARQLRLRNIGGLIVIDFIDMSTAANRHKLFNFLEKTLREQDKFQSVVLKISEFGLVQMTRKRSGKTLVQQLMETCTCCKGLGFISSVKADSFTVLRLMRETAMAHSKTKQLTVNVSTDVFNYITSIEYNAILDMEKEFKIKIIFARVDKLLRSQYKIIEK